MKANLPKSYKIYLCIIVLFAFLLVFMPRTGNFNYDYKKGAPWTYETLVAKFDFPILETREQLQREKEAADANIVPYYKYDPGISQSVIKKIEYLDLGSLSEIKSLVVSELSKMYDRGIMADDVYPKGSKHSLLDEVIFIQKGKRAYKYPSSDVYTISTAKLDLRNKIAAFIHTENTDSLLNASNLLNSILPNLIYDKETTALVHAESSNNISPTQGYVNAGQIIVSKGEIVTAEIKQLLDSYKVEYEQSLGYSGPRILLWMGNGLIALAICCLFFFTILYTCPEIFSSFNKYLFLIFIFGLAMLLSIFLERINPKLLYLVPFYVLTLYMLAFLRKKLILPIYIVSLLPLLIFAHNGLELFLINIVSGVIAIFVFQFFNRGWMQFLMAIIVFVAMLLTYLGLRLINDLHSVNDWAMIFNIFIGSILAVAAYPLIFLLEKIFGLLSDTRLLELSDTNNRLLLDLSEKAPGTFQHSLQVMNLADAAARSIDANVLLIRAGALYHDIGKTLNPQCFVENESMGRNYHQGLTPFESARDIIKHVDDGIMLAEKYNLPKEIKDFIVTHHGTTCVAYFYNKYVNDGGDPNDKDKFCYHGFKPVTKEHVILMLCDTLEAASRTLKDTSPESFDNFVEKIASSKAAEGQFDDADISLKELNTVKSVLKSYLSQIYHERIVYPTRKR